MSRKRKTFPAPPDKRRYPRDETTGKQIPLPDPTLARALRLFHRLSKYADDVLAVVLFVVAVISLFGLTGLSSGAWVEAWVDILATWFGWGAALVPLTLGVVSALIVAHNLGRLPPMKWGRVIAAEVAVFALLGMLNFANGGQVARALEGGGGGLVGWGVGYIFTRIFLSPADAFVLGIIFLACLLISLPATAERLNRLIHWLQSQGFEPGAGAQLPLPLPKTNDRAASDGRALAEKLRQEPIATARPKSRLAPGERLRVPVETVEDEIRAKPKKRDRRLPELALLDESDLRRPAQKEIDETASLIVKTLKDFGVPVTVLGARVGPSVTQYQVEPGFMEKVGPATGSVAKVLKALRDLGQYTAKHEDTTERDLIEHALTDLNLFAALGYETAAEEYVEQSRNSVFLRNSKGRTLVIMEFRRPSKEIGSSEREWDEDPLPEVGAVCNGRELWICRFKGRSMSEKPLAEITLTQTGEADARIVHNWLGKKQQWKVRVSQIATLKDDLALALSANTLRIEAPVPGQSYVGVEVPHRRTSIVGIRPVMESEAFQKINKPLALAFGRDVSGAAVAADLGAMPHLLIAGTTGSGKSVCIVSIITCLVANNTPEDLRLVMIDPKMVELVRFNGLPHLYGKVETELTRILGVLRWTVREMDRRYKLFEQTGSRNLDTYHAKLSRKKDAERLPRIVVVIDELADLMMQAPDETERMVVRLAQMARATGIHLVVATQRPSVDVVTGLIKANFPARIAFAVTSGIDSRVIIDQPGAESLLGKGDMLFLLPEIGLPVRLQGCFVTDKEVDRIVSYWREQAEEYADEPVPLNDPQAEVETTTAAEETEKPGQAPWDAMLAREQAVEDKDQQIEQAIEIVKKYGTASASLLQRKMRIGYPRAARLMDELKQMGIVGREQQGGRTREVFVGKDDDPIGQRAARILGGDEDDDE